MKLIKIITIMLITATLTFTACDGGGEGDTDEDTIVDISAIPGVTPPNYDETPVTTITETAQYTGTVSWSPSHGTFAATTVYTATITLTAKQGYTLNGMAKDFFSVAGADTISNDTESGVVTAVFPATDAAPPTVINISKIPGVTPPTYDETPVTTITETAQYTGTVAWSPNDNPFTGKTVYTATITLTAKQGYTLTGVAADFFKVTGATTVTNYADSGIITAEFPATDAAPTVIDIPVIDGITVPVPGAIPVTTITETEQYTGTVSWSPSTATFTYKIYTATITLTAKEGYTLTGVSANFFTVEGTSTPATNSADSGVVTAIFPKADCPTTYNLRDTGPAGGLIFYINPNAETDGWKYLECAPVSTEFIEKEWGGYTTTILIGTGAKGKAIGTGELNTLNITLQFGSEEPYRGIAEYAAMLCCVLDYGGYRDWFLPSIDELNAMYVNLYQEGVGGFAYNGYYWSSTEFDTRDSWSLNFSNGTQGLSFKYNTLRVRAVRAF